METDKDEKYKLRFTRLYENLLFPLLVSLRPTVLRSPKYDSRLGLKLIVLRCNLTDFLFENFATRVIIVL